MFLTDRKTKLQFIQKSANSLNYSLLICGFDLISLFKLVHMHHIYCWYWHGVGEWSLTPPHTKFSTSVHFTSSVPGSIKLPSVTVCGHKYFFTVEMHTYLHFYLKIQKMFSREGHSPFTRSCPQWVRGHWHPLPTLHSVVDGSTRMLFSGQLVLWYLCTTRYFQQKLSVNL